MDDGMASILRSPLGNIVPVGWCKDEIFRELVRGGDEGRDRMRCHPGGPQVCLIMREALPASESIDLQNDGRHGGGHRELSKAFQQCAGE